MELASLASVKAAAEKVLTLITRLDIFIANAGIIAPPGVTTDGYEIQFGTNHLGNAALTLHLLPLLLATAKSVPNADVRFVALTSLGYRGHPQEGVRFDTIRTPQADLLPALGDWGRYGQSKLANILFARELSRRYGETHGITSCAVHPGVVETDFVTELGFWNRALVRVTQLNRLITPAQGGVNTVWAATSPDVKAKLQGIGGRKGGRVAFFEPVGRPNSGQDRCFDEALMKKLWEWTEEQVGIKAPIAS
jgi:NAD(P)-dependent dehydrogenase (short-subunit alcohol dehydrogenase family)